MEEKIRNGEKELNILSWMSRAALQYIGIGGLGYSFDALDENGQKPVDYARKGDNDRVLEMLEQGLTVPLLP